MLALEATLVDNFWFGFTTQKMTLGTFVDFFLEKMELALTALRWLEISWRKKSKILATLISLVSVPSPLLPSRFLPVASAPSPPILHRRRQIFVAFFYFRIFNFPRKHFSLQVLFLSIFRLRGALSSIPMMFFQQTLLKVKEFIHICFLLAFRRLAALVDK